MHAEALYYKIRQRKDGESTTYEVCPPPAYPRPRPPVPTPPSPRRPAPLFVGSEGRVGSTGLSGLGQRLVTNTGFSVCIYIQGHVGYL